MRLSLLCAIALLVSVGCLGRSPVVARATAPPKPKFVPEDSEDDRLAERFAVARLAPFPVVPNDFESLSGVLLSPDGGALAVADSKCGGWGDGWCLSRAARTSVTVYDAQTWRARVVVDVGASLHDWAFDASSKTLFVHVENRWVGTKEVLAVDLAEGELSAPLEDWLGVALAPPARTHQRGARAVRADETQVFITNVGTGALEAALGAHPRLHVEAMVSRAAAEVVALWPTGELAAWDVVASGPARFDPPLTDHRVAVFDTDERGALMLARHDGDVWRYERDEVGIHRGRLVLENAHPTTLAIDRAHGRWFAGFADGRLRGLDAVDGKLVFSASTHAGRTTSLDLWDDQLSAWSATGTRWTFELSSSRLVGIESEGLIGLLGGDPDAPLEAVDEDLAAQLGCFGSACSVSQGMLSVRIVPGWRSGSFLLHDGAEFELLGNPGRDSVRCMHGSLVVGIEHCEASTRGVRLVAQMQARAAAFAALRAE